MHIHTNEIFKKNIMLLNQIDKIVHHFRTQNFDYALRTVTLVLNQLNSLIDQVITNLGYFNDEYQRIDSETIMNMLTSLLDAQENKDYVLLADLYELQLKPFLFKIQECIMNKEGFKLDDETYLENIKTLELHDKSINKNYESVADLLEHIDSGYSIEYTSSGLYTLAVDTNGRRFYFHSNLDVVAEAFALANYWYSTEKSNYIIYGLGFGYHVKELLSMDNNVHIEVYESDMNVLQLACAFSEIGPILKHPNITFIYDPEFVKLSKRLQTISEDDEFVIHYPSLRNIKNANVKEKLENYFIEYSSVKNQLHLLNGNFKSNIKQYNYLVDELESKFKGKDLYIIAAGPSLDKNFLKLKNVKNDSIIIATGTVFRKVLNAGICPDYIIVTDANERVYAQIAGLENEKVPMLLLSTAFKGFALHYKADKYLILQQGFKKSEEHANANGSRLFKTGGSVSTTALDVGISLGCKRIVFLGLDLAYTDNYVHAIGTSSRDLTSTEDLRQIEDINGNMIYTSKSLDIYRQWIENRIKDIKGIEFIDATEGGAKIKGMKIKKLDELIES